MSDLALTVEIDGQQLPLRDCFWVLADPAGCAFGSVHGDLAASADEAHRRLTRLQRNRERQHRQGWTVRLLTHGQWDAQAKPCFLRTCQHHTEVSAKEGDQ